MQDARCRFKKGQSRGNGISKVGIVTTKGAKGTKGAKKKEGNSFDGINRINRIGRGFARIVHG